MTLPTIIEQLEAFHRASEQQAAAGLCWIDARLARRMRFTLEGLKAAIERGDIPAAKVGRSGGFYLAPETVERLTGRNRSVGIKTNQWNG